MVMSGARSAKRPALRVVPDLADRRRQVRGALAAVTIHFQPIVALGSGTVAGYEALARFPAPFAGDPALAFTEAHAVGLGHEVEVAVLRLALDAPARPANTYLALNLSPSTLSNPLLADVLPPDLSGLVLEITEHESIADDDLLCHRLLALRRRGARTAIDDTGAEYSGLQRLMRLAPDIIKLDRVFVHGVDRSPAKAALVDAMVHFAASTGAQVVAEGVETLDELVVLADLDVGYAQGYLLAGPDLPWAAVNGLAARACRSAAAEALHAVDATTDGADEFDRISGWLTAVCSLEELASVVGPLRRLLSADEVILSVFDPASDSLDTLGRRIGAGPPERYRLAHFPATRALLTRNQSLQVLAHDPGADSAEVEEMLAGGHRSLLMVPIMAAGKPQGLLEALLREELPWTRMQVRRAQLAANHIGAVIRGMDPGPRHRGSRGSRGSRPVSHLVSAGASLGAPRP